MATKKAAATKEYAKVLVEQIVFDEATGEPMNKPFLHTVNRRGWPKFIKNHRSTGLTILEVQELPEGLEPFDPEKAYYDENQKDGGPVHIARKRVLNYRKEQSKVEK